VVRQLAQFAASLVVGLVAMRHMAGKGLLGARLEPVLGARQAILLGFFCVGREPTKLEVE
jgi:hypothetical protein